MNAMRDYHVESEFCVLLWNILANAEILCWVGMMTDELEGNTDRVLKT